MRATSLGGRPVIWGGETKRAQVGKEGGKAGKGRRGRSRMAPITTPQGPARLPPSVPQGALSPRPPLCSERPRRLGAAKRAPHDPETQGKGKHPGRAWFSPELFVFSLPKDSTSSNGSESRARTTSLPIRLPQWARSKPAHSLEELAPVAPRGPPSIFSRPCTPHKRRGQKEGRLARKKRRTQPSLP